MTFNVSTAKVRVHGDRTYLFQVDCGVRQVDALLVKHLLKD